MALHKMIRLFTMALGGEGYLTFIGNEWGHPEWIDFPRQGNNWSYHYARRQWSLVDNKKLKYRFLNEFDGEMVHVLQENKVLQALPAQKLNMDDSNKVIIFERNNLLFLFNFHPSNSIPDYRMPSLGKGEYKVLMSTDEERFGGHNRVNMHVTHHTINEDGQDKLMVYLPNRMAMVMQKVD